MSPDITPHSKMRDRLSILAITFVIMGGLAIMAAAAVIAIVGSNTGSELTGLANANHTLQVSNSQKDATARQTTTAVDTALYGFASNLDQNISIICSSFHLNCAPVPTMPTTTTTTTTRPSAHR